MFFQNKSLLLFYYNAVFFDDVFLFVVAGINIVPILVADDGSCVLNVYIVSIFIILVMVSVVVVVVLLL